MSTNSHENFSEKDREILEHFVTNTDSTIFCLRNLPEVIKGALFSRYSRSTLGLRSLLLKEFIKNKDEASFDEIVSASSQERGDSEQQIVAIKKAQNFYDRILDGYGDDSIGELGGAHLALESVSMLAAKILEDARIGGSPLEKSTRYVYFDQQVEGQFQYLREPVIMTSAFKELYTRTCDNLFSTYRELIPPLTEQIAETFPQDESTSKAAYTAALRAKVLDCLRGLLPCATLTNMGIYGNGRFFQTLLHKLQAHSLTEIQDVGQAGFEELNKVLPSFVRRARPDHPHHEAFVSYLSASEAQLKQLARDLVPKEPSKSAEVRLINYREGAARDVAAALLYPHTNLSYAEVEEAAAEWDEETIASILETTSSLRENRRHKSPRALEQAWFTFDITADFGAYRDLQRHRTLTQERQLLTCELGYEVPPELQGTALEEPYRNAMDQAAEAYKTIAAELPEEAQYVVPMGFNIRWYFHINLRALQWLCELRSGAAGHPAYRRIAQDLANEVARAEPLFERFFRFVDHSDHGLGRMEQEERKERKRQAAHV